MPPDGIRQRPKPICLGSAQARICDVKNDGIVLFGGLLLHNIVNLCICIIGYPETGNLEFFIGVFLLIFLRQLLPGLLPMGEFAGNAFAYRDLIIYSPRIDGIDKFREVACHGNAFRYDIVFAVFDLVVICRFTVTLVYKRLVGLALCLGGIAGHTVLRLPLQIVLQLFAPFFPGALAVLQAQPCQHHQAAPGDNGPHKAQGAQSHRQELEDHMISHLLSPSSL